MAKGTPGIPQGPNEDGSDVDADAEETADEAYANGGGSAAPKKKRRPLRRPKLFSDSIPDTPKLGGANTRRFPAMRRRMTMPDPDRGAVSEGEGRDQFARPIARRGQSNVTSGGDNDEVESPGLGGRRVGHFRRISVFGGGASDGDVLSTPKRPRFGGDRTTTFGGAKWRQVKSTFGLLRQKRGDRVDYFKSAELMAELRAGAPAALMLASMIQRDEHGNRRIPVLLEQIRMHIPASNSLQGGGDGERHTLFTIELEYGNGPNRMVWSVMRTIREILNLHLKYKLALSNEKLHGPRLDLGARLKQPHFPVGAFPYLRGVRGVGDSDSEDEEALPIPEGGDDAAGYATAGEMTAGEMTAGEMTAAEGTATEAEGRPSAKKRGKSRMSVLSPRRNLSAATEDNPGLEAQAQASIHAMQSKRKYVEKQRRVLEKYLQEMVRWLMFRADSNRLCRFLELSALGVRLAAEGGYHGKECYLHIQTTQGVDLRRVFTPSSVIAKHTKKWFLIRQNYIACVESPESIDIYDIFLVDTKFKIILKKNRLRQIGAMKPSKKKKKKSRQANEHDLTEDPQSANTHHSLTILNSERKIKLWSRNQHIVRQFEDSIKQMLTKTPWVQQHRFGSFAPVRTGVHARWLVDGRDYMWNVSRAISCAKDVIYIHDWWLSPELYMRRPPCISQKWRLDRLLQRKAREGVKIFVIVYRNVEAAVPIDSEYTKYALLNLHSNIFVQRSPNQFKKNQFFYAHHEKVCIVDHNIAFVGGIDLCFGRWDNPQHPLSDDKPTGFEPVEELNVPKDAEHCQLFPGKDYSNPRQQDFFKLREPYEEMYDRTQVPRMPWHDISMQVVGQPARDLTRHFVQRWNYVRRGRKATRPTPFLLPPPDFSQEDLDALGLSGTCEVQILRSASNWSLGIEDPEASIQTAYVEMIEGSDHFVYMENQFFITSTETMNVKIVNRIGDALVERIVRADRNEEDWRCVIIIPLMPGFQNTVAEQDGTSVRLILQCQFRSICRGEHSIFGRLRAEGIDPEDYIQFFSLRQWGRIGPKDQLISEQLYIHAKTIIVDDRTVLIGSANINERSMLGTRDSECAAIVRDTDMIDSTMAGRPYQVGRFAHTLRLRLMREHLGLPVDEIAEEERAEEEREAEQQAEYEAEMDRIYGDERDQETPVAESSRAGEANDYLGAKRSQGDGALASTLIGGDLAEVPEEPPQSTGSKGKSVASGSSRPSHTPEAPATNAGTSGELFPPVPPMDRRTTEQLGLPRANQLPDLPLMDDTDIGGPPLHLDMNGNLVMSDPVVNPLAADIKMADVTKDCMRDPLNPTFYDDIWARVAENNTKLFRRVFRVMPDSAVKTWHDYTDYISYQMSFRDMQEGPKPTKPEESEAKPGTAESEKRAQSEKRKEEAAANTDAKAAGGAGIGAPGPQALPRTLHSKLAGLVSKGNNEKPLPPLPKDGSDAENKSAPPRHARQDSRLDIEKAAAAQRALSTPLASPNPQSNGYFPPISNGTTATLNKATSSNHLAPEAGKKERRATFSNTEKPDQPQPPTSSGGHGTQPMNGVSVKRRRRATTRGSRRGLPSEDVLTKPEAEGLCSMMQGTLVQFPYDWLLTEEENGNWLYQVDQVAPLQI